MTASLFYLLAGVVLILLGAFGLKGALREVAQDKMGKGDRVFVELSDVFLSVLGQGNGAMNKAKFVGPIFLVLGGLVFSVLGLMRGMGA